MLEREIDPRRLVWVGPLTIVCANVAVLTVRHVALMLVTPPVRFAPLGVGPAVIDTTILVSAGILVFVVIAANAANPYRLYRWIAFVALLVSWIPDMLLPGRWPSATWPLAMSLMAMHVAAWWATVTILTGLTGTGPRT